MSEVVNERSLSAAQAALDAHRNALGIEGDASIQLWHLLVSLHEYCAANKMDFDAELAEVREGLVSGELDVPAWEAFSAAKGKSGQTRPPFGR